ncbi:MAG: hypothetical protein OXQ90_16870 [Gammaproteobacteria bacterium]|nr:hypothetical protein [Gammaproteobacteria bacterium]
MPRIGQFGWVIGTLLLMLPACQTTVGSDERLIPAADLLSGKVVFGVEVSSTERPDVDLLGTDEAMREFVADLRLDSPNPARFRHLMERMRSSGYALSGYDPYANLSARDAFAEKRGNCLTYTSLFIAFAREVGFEASYQLVDVPPDYDSVNGMVVLNKHVNARVDHVPGRGSVTVEFSEEFASGIHDRRVVDDAFALALHYNNLAFSDDLAGDERGAFVYLKKAIDLSPDNPDLWTNLGVFHARRGHFVHAIAGYRQALDLDAHHGAAMRGLANAYGALGRDDKARFYQRRVAYSRARDAYTYYTLAQRAYMAQRPTESLELLSEAIRLYRRDHRFYRLKGEVHDRLGNTLAANESYKRARGVAREEVDRARRRSLEEHHPRATVYRRREILLF